MIAFLLLNVILVNYTIENQWSILNDSSYVSFNISEIINTYLNQQRINEYYINDFLKYFINRKKEVEIFNNKGNIYFDEDLISCNYNFNKNYNLINDNLLSFTWKYQNVEPSLVTISPELKTSKESSINDDLEFEEKINQLKESLYFKPVKEEVSYSNNFIYGTEKTLIVNNESKKIQSYKDGGYVSVKYDEAKKDELPW